MKLSFEIENIDSLDDDLFEMMIFQSNRVNLNNRLLKEVNLFLTSFNVSMEALYATTSNSELIKTLLLQSERQFNSKMGVNDWRSSLLHALAHNHEFCDGGFRSVLGVVVDGYKQFKRN